MSEQLDKKCPICGSYLFSDDDLVHCPECGAPHHRDCWQAVGHCGRLELHGKEQPEEPEEKKNICPKCGKEMPEDANFCPWCGINEDNNKNEQNAEQADFRTFNIGGKTINLDPYGGVDKNSDIDGVRAEDVAKFIGYNTQKFLPMFVNINEGKGARWNWVAFLSPYCHSLFRKMNLHFVVYLIFEIVGYMLLTPFYQVVAKLGTITTAQLMQPEFVMEHFSNPYVLLSMLLGSAFLVVPRIFAAKKCEIHYKKHVVETIKEIRADMDADEDEEFQKKGKARPFLSIFLFVLSTYFGSIIPYICLELMAL